MINPQTTAPNIIQEFVNRVLLETLTDRERKIAALRPRDVFGFDLKQMTLRQAGEQEGVSRERVRQMVAKINRKIKRKIFIVEQQLKEPQVIIKYIEKTEGEKTPNLPIVYKPIEALGEMTVRVTNALHCEEIKTVQQLIEKKEGELLRLPNFGRKSLNELKELLADHNLKLGETP